MCGLFSLSHSSKEVGTYFDYGDEAQFPPREYVAPGQAIAIVRARENTNPGMREFALVRWGFVPGWAKEIKPGKPLINARAETITEKPSFRHAVRRRRCLVPASGFYEWQGDVPGKKTTYYVPRANGGLIGLAGIWEHWMGPDGSELETAAIITTAANETLGRIHHRMPVVIRQKDFSTWLTPEETDLSEVSALMVSAPEDFFAPEPTEIKRPAKPKPPKPQLDLF